MNARLCVAACLLAVTASISMWERRPQAADIGDLVVLADDDTRLVARLDDVAVLHRRRLGEWLARQPLQLDHATIARIRAAVGATA